MYICGLYTFALQVPYRAVLILFPLIVQTIRSAKLLYAGAESERDVSCVSGDMAEAVLEDDVLPPAPQYQATQEPPKPEKHKNAKGKAVASEKDVPSSADGFLVQVITVAVLCYFCDEFQFLPCYSCAGEVFL